MLKVGKDELICDLAETYGIINYEGLSPSLVAILSCGLNNDSRIKRKISGQKYGLDSLLNALVLDGINFLCWTKTKDAQKGRNKPKSVFDKLMEEDSEKENELMSFETPEEFEAYMKGITENG